MEELLFLVTALPSPSIIFNKLKEASNGRRRIDGSPQKKNYSAELYKTTTVSGHLGP